MHSSPFPQCRINVTRTTIQKKIPEILENRATRYALWVHCFILIRATANVATTKFLFPCCQFTLSVLAVRCCFFVFFFFWWSIALNRRPSAAKSSTHMHFHLWHFVMSSMCCMRPDKDFVFSPLPSSSWLHIARYSLLFLFSTLSLCGPLQPLNQPSNWFCCLQIGHLDPLTKIDKE